MNIDQIRIFTYTLLALLAFAGNSILCRLALKDSAIDANSFTLLRLLSGILTLVILLRLNRQKPIFPSFSGVSISVWFGGIALFIYAALFSLAYISLDTGIGALILFGSVQLTVVLVSWWRGERLRLLEWLGLLLSFFGLVYLLIPSNDKAVTVSLLGFVLMAIAGIAWGAYSLIGRGSTNPLMDTTHNFIRTLPLCFLLLLAFMWQGMSLSLEGAVLAIASGAITSGLGYAIWYAALKGLSRLQAGVVQLLVPVIASIGGVIFADELLTWKLVIASAMVLGGILLLTVKPQES